MPSESRYEELSEYMEQGSARIARESIGEGVKDYKRARNELASRILAFVRDCRIIDREIQVQAIDEWRNLPVIE